MALINDYLLNSKDIDVSLPCDKCDGDGWDYVVTDRYSSKKEKRGSNDRK